MNHRLYTTYTRNRTGHCTKYVYSFFFSTCPRQCPVSQSCATYLYLFLPTHRIIIRRAVLPTLRFLVDTATFALLLAHSLVVRCICCPLHMLSRLRLLQMQYQLWLCCVSLHIPLPLTVDSFVAVSVTVDVQADDVVAMSWNESNTCCSTNIHPMSKYAQRHATRDSRVKTYGGEGKRQSVC